MVVRSTVKTTSKPDKDLEVFAKQFTDLVQELAERAFTEIQVPLLDELQFYPPERPNQRYVRTFRLRRGWKAGLTRLGSGQIAMVISNDVEYATFVVGSLAQNLSAASSFQADMHKNRWPLATETVQFWQNAYLDELEQLFIAELQQFGDISSRKRAFTRVG